MGIAATAQEQPSTSRLIAIARRRQSRANASARKAERLNREREVVIRLSARALRHGFAFSLLQLDYRYWQLRSCGWDILTKELSRGADDKPCSPDASATWRWWVALHWRQREQIRVASLLERRRAARA